MLGQVQRGHKYKRVTCIENSVVISEKQQLIIDFHGCTLDAFYTWMMTIFKMSDHMFWYECHTVITVDYTNTWVKTDVSDYAKWVLPWVSQYTACLPFTLKHPCCHSDNCYLGWRILGNTSVTHTDLCIWHLGCVSITYKDTYKNNVWCTWCLPPLRLHYAAQRLEIIWQCIYCKLKINST